MVRDIEVDHAAKHEAEEQRGARRRKERETRTLCERKGHAWGPWRESARIVNRGMEGRFKNHRRTCDRCAHEESRQEPAGRSAAFFAKRSPK